jgi:uncharacterized RDD family membrane protein YckC
MKRALQRLAGAAVALVLCFALLLVLLTLDELGVLTYRPAFAYAAWGFAIAGWKFPAPFLRPFRAAWGLARSVGRRPSEG